MTGEESTGAVGRVELRRGAQLDQVIREEREPAAAMDVQIDEARHDPATIQRSLLTGLRGQSLANLGDGRSPHPNPPRVDDARLG